MAIEVIPLKIVRTIVANKLIGIILLNYMKINTLIRKIPINSFANHSNCFREMTKVYKFTMPNNLSFGLRINTLP